MGYLLAICVFDVPNNAWKCYSGPVILFWQAGKLTSWGAGEMCQNPSCVCVCVFFFPVDTASRASVFVILFFDIITLGPDQRSLHFLCSKRA